MLHNLKKSLQGWFSCLNNYQPWIKSWEIRRLCYMQDTDLLLLLLELWFSTRSQDDSAVKKKDLFNHEMCENVYFSLSNHSKCFILVSVDKALDQQIPIDLNYNTRYILHCPQGGRRGLLQHTAGSRNNAPSLPPGSWRLSIISFPDRKQTRRWTEASERSVSLLHIQDSRFLSL